MPVATAVPLSDWLSHTALQLSDAVGWPITWSDAASNRAGSASAEGAIEVDDGTQVVGRLLVETPDEGRLHPAFHAAREVADVFARVLSRLVAANRKLQCRSESIASLQDFGQPASHAEDLPTMLSRLMRTAMKSAGMWSAAFFLMDPRTSRLRLRATYNLPAKSLPENCEIPQSARLLDPHRPEDCVALPKGFAVGVLAPVMWESSVVGSLLCFDRRQRQLGEWEIQVLQSVAVQIGAMLERTVLVEESAQRRQLQSDLRIASRALPIGLVQPLPHNCGLDVSVRAASVIEVGGDLCDVISLDNQRTLIAIGDAVGHGIPAAMLVSVARGALRALVTQSSPEQLATDSLMTGVNRALQPITRSEQFVTLMLAIVDPRSDTLTYTNAGHPPPLMRSNGDWRSLRSHGLFLGVSPDVQYSATELPLSRDDVLVGFTDGVTETINRSQQVFRRQSIRDTIPAAADASADTIADAIWQRLQSHDPDRPLRDDRTLLVLRYLGGE